MVLYSTLWCIVFFLLTLSYLPFPFPLQRRCLLIFKTSEWWRLASRSQLYCVCLATHPHSKQDYLHLVQNASRRHPFNCLCKHWNSTSSDTGHVSHPVVLKFSLHELPCLLCPALYLLHSLLLAELTLPAISTMLVLSWLSWHIGVCHPKCTTGLVTKFLGTLSKWMLSQYQGPNFALRLSQQGSPLGIEGFWAASSSNFCLNSNVSNNQTFGFGFASPLCLSGANCSPQDFKMRTHNLASWKSSYVSGCPFRWNWSSTCWLAEVLCFIFSLSFANNF